MPELLPVVAVVPPLELLELELLELALVVGLVVVVEPDPPLELLELEELDELELEVNGAVMVEMIVLTQPPLEELLELLAFDSVGVVLVLPPELDELLLVSVLVGVVTVLSVGWVADDEFEFDPLSDGLPPPPQPTVSVMTLASM